MDIHSEIERQLIEASAFDEPPESWYVIPGEDGPRLRGRWVEATEVRDQQPRYYEVEAPEELSETLAELLADLSDRYSIEVESYPPQLYDYSTISVEERSRRLDPSEDGNGFVGVIRFRTANIFDHEIADEEAYFLLSRQLDESEFDGVTLTDDNVGDIRALFESDTVSHLDIYVDGKRHLFTRAEVEAAVLRIFEEVLADYQAVVDIDGECWFESGSFAFINSEDAASPERATFSVHVPL